MKKKATSFLIFLIITSLYVFARNLNYNFGDEINGLQLNRIKDSVKSIINRYYFDPVLGKNIVDKLPIEFKDKKYDKPASFESFIRNLNIALKAISNDGHLYIETKQNSPQNWEEMEKQKEINSNFGFVEVKILNNNIGYLKIVEFMNPKRSLQTAVAAMKFLENTKGLIIDIRGNSGGYAGTAEYILNHYFEGEPQVLAMTKGRHNTNQLFSSDLIYGKLRINTPLYILIDSMTASAAEFLAYTLQAFDKALVVGEPSAGGAHRSNYFNLPFDMRMSVSIAVPINPITNTNWEQIGVLPDIISDHPLEEVLQLTNQLND